MKASVSILVLTVLIPIAGQLVGRYQQRTGTDWAICRMSLLLLAIGNFVIGLVTQKSGSSLGRMALFFIGL
jgi:hypothetical protein